MLPWMLLWSLVSLPLSTVRPRWTAVHGLPVRTTWGTTWRTT